MRCLLAVHPKVRPFVCTVTAIGLLHETIKGSLEYRAYTYCDLGDRSYYSFYWNPMEKNGIEIKVRSCGKESHDNAKVNTIPVRDGD